MQATEVIKLILGVGKPLIGHLVLVDALAMRFREMRMRKNPECPVYGAHPTVTKLIDYNQLCGVRGEESQTTTRAKIPAIQVEEFKRRLDAGEDIFVLDVREPHEYQIPSVYMNWIQAWRLWFTARAVCVVPRLWTFYFNRVSSTSPT
jgi:adenylyltransferase/sulfurtransferase